jgi:hypothetical protein
VEWVVAASRQRTPDSREVRRIICIPPVGTAAGSTCGDFSRESLPLPHVKIAASARFFERISRRVGALAKWNPGVRMIASMTRKLKLHEPGRLIIETASVGREIFAPVSTDHKMSPAGAEIELEVRQIVREDAILPYGFSTVGSRGA